MFISHYIFYAGFEKVNSLIIAELEWFWDDIFYWQLVLFSLLLCVMKFLYCVIQLCPGLTVRSGEALLIFFPQASISGSQCCLIGGTTCLYRSLKTVEVKVPILITHCLGISENYSVIKGPHSSKGKWSVEFGGRQMVYGRISDTKWNGNYKTRLAQIFAEEKKEKREKRFLF